MTIFIIGLALLVLVSGYFFFSDYFQIFKKTSEEKVSPTIEPVVEATKSTQATKKPKVNPTKEVKVKPSVKKEVKPKATKKVNPKTSPVEAPKTKRGRKKKS